MLTLQFIPYSEIEGLGSARRVHKLLDIVKQNKIVLMQGRLKKEEETDLIQITMNEISRKFKGIELAVINPQKKFDNPFINMKQGVLSALLGDRAGFTIIGPASIVKEIKKDPDKIELFTKTGRSKKTKKK